MADDPKSFLERLGEGEAYGSPEAAAPGQPYQASGDFLSSVQRPGMGQNQAADFVKAITQMGAGAIGGAPGGLPGMAIGAGLSGLGMALSPESTRPAVGAGNLTEALSGPLASKLGALKPLAQFTSNAPITSQALSGAATGAAQGYADALDRGTDNRGLAALFGGLLGGGMGTGGGIAQKALQKGPSAIAANIDRLLSSYSKTPTNAPALTSSAQSLLQDVSGGMEKASKAADLAESAAKSDFEAEAIGKLAKKQAPVTAGMQTKAATAGEEVAKQSRMAKFLATADIDDAADYLKKDYGKDLGRAQKALSAFDEAMADIEGDPGEMAKTFRASLQEEVDNVKAIGEYAQEMVSRAHRGEAKLAGQNVAGDIEAASPAAKKFRKAQLDAQVHETRLKNLRNQAATAEDSAKIDRLQEKYFSTMAEAAFNSTGIDPSKMSRNAQTFLNTIKGKEKTLTLTQAVDTALSDPSHARGLREILETKSPEMLNAVRSHYLYTLFQGARSSHGGVNIPSKIYDAKKLMDLVNNVPGKRGEGVQALNELFGDPQAYAFLKRLAESAVDAERFVRPRGTTNPGHIAMTGAGALLFASQGRLTTDLQSAMMLVGLAGGGYLAVNIPRWLEHFVQNPGITGRALTAYMRSENPTQLPREVTQLVQQFAAPMFSEGAADTKAAPGSAAGPVQRIGTTLNDALMGRKQLFSPPQ